MDLTNRDIVELVEFRHLLHRFPEISGEEEKTAQRVVEFLTPCGPDEILTGMGGHGVAAVFDSGTPGPTLLFRSELDALPIEELSGVAHSSQIAGKSHMCGHEGHTAILAAMARVLGRRRPGSGRVVLMFQPAEETGDGAAGVIADPRYASIAPDYALSLHNFPGTPLGHVRIRDGVVACASRGMRTTLTGKTAHSSMPETGTSPMRAVSALMPRLGALGQGSFADEAFAMATVTHCSMGEAVFGIAPGRAEIWTTLRTRRDDRMADLCAAAEALVTEAAADAGLSCAIDYHEIFVASVNAPEAADLLRAALDVEGIPYDEEGLPMRASEDFGLFGRDAKSAMMFLGAGESHPALHNPDYDFPDELIPVGARVFLRVVDTVLG